LKDSGRVEPFTLFGKPTYTKNQAINQKNLENFAEKISHLDTLENCEKTIYRLVPNLLKAYNPLSQAFHSVESG